MVDGDFFRSSTAHCMSRRPDLSPPAASKRFVGLRFDVRKNERVTIVRVRPRSDWTYGVVHAVLRAARAEIITNEVLRQPHRRKWIDAGIQGHRRQLGPIDRHSAQLGLAHHPSQRDEAQSRVAIAPTDIRMTAAKPDFVRACNARHAEGTASLVEGNRMETVLHAARWQCQVVPDV